MTKFATLALAFVALFFASFVASASAGEYKMAENSQYFGKSLQVYNASNGTKISTYQSNSSELRKVLCEAIKSDGYKGYKFMCRGTMKLVACGSKFTTGNLRGKSFPTLCVSKFDGKKVYVNYAKKYFDLDSESFVN